jgi:hypothetical protein
MRGRRWVPWPQTCAQVALGRLEQNLRELQRPALPADAARETARCAAARHARRPAWRRARA